MQNTTCHIYPRETEDREVRRVKIIQHPSFHSQPSARSYLFRSSTDHKPVAHAAGEA